MSKHNNPLTKTVDMLFTLALFYLLIHWPQLSLWQSKVLYVSLFLIVLNEQVSVRASYDVYNTITYFLDLVSIYIYVVALDALMVVDLKFGYAPKFWIYIGFLWLFYAVWDYVMIPFADEEAKKNLRKWGLYMISAFFVTILSYLVISYAYHYFQGETLYRVETIAQIVAFGIIIWAIYLWNKDRISRAIEVINEAKGTKKF